MQSDYSTLGLPRSASLKQIKQAYKDLAIKYHPDKMRNNPFLDPIDFKNIKHSYESLLKKKQQPRENTIVLKELVDQIPSSQLKYYEEVLEGESESEEDQDEEYLLEQTLSLNELRQKANEIEEGDSRGESGREGEEEQKGKKDMMTLTGYRNLKDCILSRKRKGKGKGEQDQDQDDEDEREDEYVPSRQKLREMIRKKQPIFQIIH